ncbi:MAG: AMP-binding protein [Bacteroidales bacterium]|nr:AMP-binding protein [Bacteroidales bacterium]MCF8456943.1 AMP-binding protein [Bacteroidales bacterium]
MKTIAAIYRTILTSRYKISVHGEDLLKSNAPKLFLPNHQAHVDPQILTTLIFKHSSFRPIASARFFNKPLIRGVFKKLKAVPINNIQSSGKIDKDEVSMVIESAVDILNNGENVLIYPSGQIAGQGFEKIFNKSTAYNIVKKVPGGTQIIGVRISGLWGSMWSKAWTGDIPSVFKTFGKALFYVLANLIFLVPKRIVKVEFVDITNEAKKYANEGKKQFNDSLESFYNIKEEEVNFLKHFFYAPKSTRRLPEKIVGSVKEMESTNSINPNDIPKSVIVGVKETIANETGMDTESLHLASNLTMDLGMDSLVLVGLVAAIENKFGSVFDGDYARLKTVGDLCFIAMGADSIQQDLKVSTLSDGSETKTRVTVNPSLNIRDQFIQTCLSNKKAPLVYDKMMGSNNRKDFLLKAIVVSKLIRKNIKDKRVGIMLPALESTTLLIMATFFAGKIPVMLNWTVGKKTLQSCIESAQLHQVITATSFFDKVEDQLPAGFNDMCLFFDKEINKVSLGTKVMALIELQVPKVFYPRNKLDEIAVILFTSGSETVPKAVPLTHKNIMYNLWGVLDKIELYNTDILLGFLPPFHSFGFTVLSVLPLVAGIKVAYTPDPKNSREIARVLTHTKASVLLATPTFLKLIMSVAADEDFNSVRLAVTGAESLHPSIANQFKAKTGGVAMLFQGYGITECSPILSITSTQTKDIKSVGQFISGVSHQIIDLNSGRPLQNGQEGMITVSGNSIFNGYLDPAIPSPFISIEGKEYYKTGDLGYVDKHGDLYITGRLKRFVKIGGEMISLPAIESALLEKYSSHDEQILAVEADELGDKPKIILFSTNGISLNEANKYLREQGFSNLMKIHKTHYVVEIPLLGTGKTDYKLLKQMAEELNYA